MIDINALVKEATIKKAKPSHSKMRYVVEGNVYSFNRILSPEEAEAFRDYLMKKYTKNMWVQDKEVCFLGTLLFEPTDYGKII